MCFLFIQGGSALQCYVCNDNTEMTADATYNANCADASPPNRTLISCKADETHCSYQYIKAVTVTTVRGCAKEATSSYLCNEVMCTIQRSCDTDGCNIGDKNYNGTTTAGPGNAAGNADSAGSGSSRVGNGNFTIIAAVTIFLSALTLFN